MVSTTVSAFELVIMTATIEKRARPKNNRFEFLMPNRSSKNAIASWSRPGPGPRTDVFEHIINATNIARRGGPLLGCSGDRGGNAGQFVSGFAKPVGNCDEKPMASGGVGEPFCRREYQVGKAVHLLTMNLSPSIARSRLTLHLDLGRALAGQEVERAAPE
jgi:hypothetical protein